MGSVLIVDDSPDAGRALAKLLKRFGHDAACATSGEEALRHLQTAEPLPHVVLLDVMMPGMDGVEVLRRIRDDSRTAGLPVILWTAVGDPAFEAHARSKGASDYLVKGHVDFHGLTSRLAQFMPGP